MESDSSDTNLVIRTKRARAKWFLKLYWRIVVLFITPLMLLPVYFIGQNNAYKTLYVFSITNVYWITDVMHPGVISLIPITIYTLIGINMHLSRIVPVGSELFDCLSIMIVILAIENCKLNRRIAVKLLIIFGCSHYKLSLMLFFCTMFLSMWLTDIIACGLMMPLLKAILAELEKMGIVEMHHTMNTLKNKPDHHEQNNPKPTDFTVFYFLGIAYSASIGSMATIIGSQSNKVFRMYCESLFLLSPKIEYPHMILLNLPGVLLMEGLLYLWMNSYFLGMFRPRTDLSLEIGISEEEAQYIRTLLSLQYQQLGKITFHETIVGVIILLTCILQMSFGFSFTKNEPLTLNLKTSAPCMLSAILLFITPINLEFIKFFKRRGREPLPIVPSKSCLNWNLMRNKMNWSVLFVIVGSACAFSSLQQSGLLNSVDVLLPAGGWPPPVLALLVVLLCKLAGEAATSGTVAYCLLPMIARLSVANSVNPHYLMLAATMSLSLPFHLITGSPVNAMVAAYVHIPPWKMMSAGIGPSVISVVVVWFTVAVWSKVVWTDIHLLPHWAHQLANVTT